MAAIEHFKEDIARAYAIIDHAELLPKGNDAEKSLREDLLRSAWMFGVGALDAYFCDLYTDLLASVLMCKERQSSIKLPKAIMGTEVPLDAVYADYKHRKNWRWRMMARRRMERENVLSTESIKKLLNHFLPPNEELFGDVIDRWIKEKGATKRLFGIPPKNYLSQRTTASSEPDKNKRAKKLKALRDSATAALKNRLKKIIQRRHDCIHNCDRPKSSLTPVRSPGSVRFVLNDIEFLVLNTEKHVAGKFRQFLSSLGCTPQTINQVGY